VEPSKPSVSRAENLLNAIREAQRLFLRGRCGREVFEVLLTAMLAETSTELGMVTEARHDEDRRKVLFGHVFAQPGQDFAEAPALARRLRESRGLTFELGPAHPVWGELFEADSPWIDDGIERRDLLAPWCESEECRIRALIGVPFPIDADTPGLIVLLKRAPGIESGTLDRIGPLVDTIATLTHAIGFATEVGASVERVSLSRERRRVAERSLAASNRLLIEAQRLGSMGHFVVDPESGRLSFSSELIRLLGQDSPELSSTAFYDLVHPHDRTLVQGAIDAAVGGAPFDLECRMRLGEAQIKHVHIKGRLDAALDRRGSVVFATLQDVSHRKELENHLREARAAADAANQAKSVFLAKMSHELRTPLNAIIGFSAMLEDQHFGPLTSKQSSYVEKINSSGRHLLAIVSDLLDVSRIEAGQLSLRPSRTSVEGLLKDVVGILAPEASEKGIDLQCEAILPLPDIVVDVVRLRQVLYNLLSNALKFTQRGGRVRLVARRVVGELELSVSDTGVGIPPNEREHLFREFVQPGRLRQGPEGAGLGLALVRTLTEMHGGRVRVESQVGVGSTFFVYLPLEDGLISNRPMLLDAELRSK